MWHEGLLAKLAVCGLPPGVRQWVNIFLNGRSLFVVVKGSCSDSIQDAVHITAILGESVVFNCHVEFPEGHPVPYVLQWEKKVGDTVRTNHQPY
nr:unnamed protein product [Callosobruchus analis]